MSENSSIEWTDATWNPVRGCTKVSPGCKHCYAEAFAERFRGVPGHPYEQGFDLRLVPSKLEEPLRWREPRRVFVNSMSDLFHEGIPDVYVRNVFGVMEHASRHTFQVLTKRAERMRSFVNEWASEIDYAALPKGYDIRYSHVWLGVSVEDRTYGLPRVEALRNTRAAVRFLSVEPLLEDLGPLDLTGIHWVIVGGESGPGARPFDLLAARRIVEQCKALGVACFVKQLGAKPVFAAGENWSETRSFPTRDRKGGDWSEWPADLRVREFPRSAS